MKFCGCHLPPCLQKLKLNENHSTITQTVLTVRERGGEVEEERVAPVFGIVPSCATTNIVYI